MDNAESEVIVVAGPERSGRTTLANYLAEQNMAAVISPTTLHRLGERPETNAEMLAAEALIVVRDLVNNGRNVVLEDIPQLTDPQKISSIIYGNWITVWIDQDNDDHRRSRKAFFQKAREGGRPAYFIPNIGGLDNLRSAAEKLINNRSAARQVAI